MALRLLNATALVALLAAGSVFAAEPPMTTPAAAPPAAAATAAVPPAATAAPPVSETPAAASPAEMPAAMPAVHHRHVSACTRSIEKAEKVLASAKASPDAIAGAWQHLDAAKQARMNHQASACEMESQAATKML